MFHGTLNKLLRPIVIPVLRHVDQPERRGINMLKLGKESNHARWKYSLNIKSCGHKLHSCTKCSALIEQYFLDGLNTPGFNNLFSCTQCSNWSFDKEHKVLHTLPPDDFPET